MGVTTVENEIRDRIDQEIAEHTMTVIKDDGVHRHLRFSRGGSSLMWFELVTWPGSLAIHGDCGTYVFSRIHDMFEFFRTPAGAINPHYWSQKLQAPAPKDVRVYNEVRYKQTIADWLAEKTEDLDTAEERDALTRAVQQQLLDDPYDALHDEQEAYRRVRDFHHDGIEIYDPHEMDFREDDRWFLGCCWLIVRGIAMYTTGKQDDAT